MLPIAQYELIRSAARVYKKSIRQIVRELEHRQLLIRRQDRPARKEGANRALSEGLLRLLHQDVQ